MPYELLADVLVLTHLIFVVFVVAGGLLVLRWPKVAWFHLPAAIWGTIVEWAGWVCPLTPSEQWLRRQAGGQGYEGEFVTRYILPLLYPAALTQATQLVLGAIVLTITIGVYAVAIRRHQRRREL